MSTPQPIALAAWVALTARVDVNKLDEDDAEDLRFALAIGARAVPRVLAGDAGAKRALDALRPVFLDLAARVAEKDAEAANKVLTAVYETLEVVALAGLRLGALAAVSALKEMKL